MGVPTFYRWLVTRYPKIVKHTYEHMDSDEYIRRKRINEEGEVYYVNDLVDYVNNTDKEHCSDNINGYFDNLYLDMNGIIHCCSHSSKGTTPSSNAEIFMNIFLYIERLFDIIEPQKLLFMAIDGVAPKAKMNQQRSRRFKSILDSEIEKNLYHQLKTKFVAENREVPEEPVHWDSNVITPGTQFMHELSIALKYFIEYKITHDEKWKQIVVIFSDASVCGEGEHKIYNFIKSQRCQKDYNPNIRHVIHGMDADLIMLSLASHEPYFYILREVFELDPKTDEEKKHNNFIGTLHNQENVNFCIKMKIKNKKYNKYKNRNYANVLATPSVINFTDSWNELQILDLTILREYLAKDFEFQGQFSMERCIDDFIFICFLCGNDFLPRLPSISIASGSIDQLILLYQNVLPVIGDYLTCEGILNLKPVCKFLSFIAEVERETFVSQHDFKKRREQREQELKANMKKVKYESEGTKENKQNDAEGVKKRETEENPLQQFSNKSTYMNSNNNKTINEDNMEQKNLQQQDTQHNWGLNSEQNSNIISKKMSYDEKSINMELTGIMQYKEKTGEHKIKLLEHSQKNVHNDITKTAEKENMRGDMCLNLESDKPEESNSVNEHKESLSITQKEIDIEEFNALLKEAIKKAKENENPQEDVELGADEDPKIIRSKYYRSKFHLDETDDIEPFVRTVVKKYFEGLSWILLYYFQTCPMWHWYYPYYYSPLSSDLVVDNLTIHFEKDEPLLPFEQLLSVLPANSCHCLPKAYRGLMLQNDSPIIDFYPTSFKEEENGKKYKYQWTVLLPFVDKDRLVKHAASLHETLTEEEKKRNRNGFNRIYVDKTHPICKQMRTANRKILLEITEQEQKAIQAENGTNETNKETLRTRDSSKRQSNIALGELYKKVDAKVPIEYVKEVNIFGFFYFKHDDEEAQVLKRILRFTSSFSSTCNSSFFLLPPFGKHRSSLLANHVRPKQALSLEDINNESRRHRFNAAAARRIILNSLSNNHPHIYSYVKMNTYRNHNMNYSNFGDPYNNRHSYNNHATGYMYGTTNDQPFVANYVKPPNNYNNSLMHKTSQQYGQPYGYQPNNHYQHRSAHQYPGSGRGYNPQNTNFRSHHPTHTINYSQGGGYNHRPHEFDSSYRGYNPRHFQKYHNSHQINSAHSYHSYNYSGRMGREGGGNIVPDAENINAAKNTVYRNNNNYGNPRYGTRDHKRYM